MKKLIAALALMFPVMSACAEVDHSYPDAQPAVEEAYVLDCLRPPRQPTLIPVDASAEGVTLSPLDYARVVTYMANMAAFLASCECSDQR